MGSAPNCGGNGNGKCLPWQQVVVFILWWQRKTKTKKIDLFAVAIAVWTSLKVPFTQCGSDNGFFAAVRWKCSYCATVAALLLQHATAAAAQIGYNPIYLWHHCHSRSSVNTHIESNTTHLLWQKQRCRTVWTDLNTEIRTYASSWHLITS